MDTIRVAQKARRRAVFGLGRIVVSRDPRKGNRLNITTFASLASAKDFKRRATLNGIKIVGSL